MRVCDISKSESVVGTVIVSIAAEGEQPTVVEYEVGPSALKAFQQRDWQALNKLTPYDERVKDTTRSEGAKKAAATRAANRQAADDIAKIKGDE